MTVDTGMKGLMNWLGLEIKIMKLSEFNSIINMIVSLLSYNSFFSNIFLLLETFRYLQN
jgi:hypothetical protein